MAAKKKGDISCQMGSLQRRALNPVITYRIYFNLLSLWDPNRKLWWPRFDGKIKTWLPLLSPFFTARKAILTWLGSMWKKVETSKKYETLWDLDDFVTSLLKFHHVDTGKGLLSQGNNQDIFPLSPLPPAAPFLFQFPDGLKKRNFLPPSYYAVLVQCVLGTNPRKYLQTS